MKERSKNAYLLFYERNKNYDENGVEISQMSVPEESEVSPKLFNEIKEDNVKYYINKNCFDTEFSTFVSKITHKMVDSNRFSDPISLDLYKLGFLYFLSVAVRFKDREKLIPPMMKILKKALGSNIELANWFLMNASSEETIRETLIECPIRDIKYIISGLYIEAIKKVIEEKRESGFRMLDISLNLLLECKERKLMDVFYRIFTIYSRSSKIYKQYLLEKKFIPLLFYYITEQNIPNELIFIKPQPLEYNELGGITKKKTINIRSIEEIVEKKKEKSFLESITINYSNLIISFSNIVCSFSLNEAANTKNRPNNCLLEPVIDYKLETDERKILLSSPFWRKIWVECQSKSCWQANSRLFCHLSTNNKPLTLDIMKAGLEELVISDDNLKVYLKMFEQLMILDDEFKGSRTKYLIEKLMNIFKEGLKYYKSSVTLLDYFFKMSGRHTIILKGFSDYFSENKQILRATEEWIKSLKDLSYHINSGSYSIYKKRKANFNGQIIQLSK